MNRVQNRTVGFAGLVLMLWVGLSWGELPAGNDTSNADGNTGGGSGALVKTISIFNTAYGAGALENNTSGIFNTASGSFALMRHISGSFNTTSGGLALMRHTAGDANAAFGAKALQQKITGDNNTAIGASAGFNLMSGNHNIYLGHPGDATESNTMRLGHDGDQKKTFIAGIAGVTVSNSAAVLIDMITGQLGTLVSSARYKQDIHDMGERSRALFQLRPITFRYTQDSLGVLQYGLIAEEVDAVYPELVVRGAEGMVEAVRYHALIPLLLNELQHQQHQLLRNHNSLPS